MIYTSYFANMKKLPDNVIPISICGKAPDWYTGLQYKKLAPKYGFFMEWKKNKDNNYYIDHFNKEVLDALTPQQVIKDLSELTSDIRVGKRNVVLLCYEKPSDFCHRHLVAEWFGKYGIEVKEI